MRIRILPYRQGSRSARSLADAIGGRVLRLQGSRFRPRGGDFVINWGMADENSQPHVCVAIAKGLWDDEMVFLNSARKLRNASNKLNFFNLMVENNADIIPQFWTNRNDIPTDAYPVVCRTVLAGHSGDGIVIADTPEEVVDAPLYTKYIKKQDEYRIHVGKLPNGDTSIISVQRKARREGHEDPNWRVRNHNNGFVFVRGGVNPPQEVLDASTRALLATGLDFGAVDVIWNAREQRAYVLEINTAPGLEGQTVTDYVSFFQEFM